MVDVTLIGAGQMGRRLARRVMAAGHRVLVYDPSVDACAALAAGGAIVLGSAAAGGDADVVVVLVLHGAQARAALTGSEGLLAGLSPRRTPLVFLMSTISPEEVRALADALVHEGCG